MWPTQCKIFIKNKSGLSIVEIILASAIFLIFSSGAVISMIQAYNANRLGMEFTIASQFASEGLEAARSIKNQQYSSIVNTAQTGVTRGVGGSWAFSGTSNTFTADKQYTRIIKIEDVRRDAAPPLGNIVASGGTVDANTKKITSTVNWNFTATRPEAISLVTYLSDWRKAIVPQRGGMLVYADGGTTTDAVKYRVLDSTGIWGAITAMPDFDTSATNKVMRVVRVFASSTRNEKVVVARHYNGTQQSIWTHVYNGTTWSSSQMVSWTSSAFDTANLGVKNFEGGYLNNGNFMVVYSDNTTTPRYRTWNGSAWTPTPAGVGSTTTNIGGIPANITFKVRPGSNEAMLTVFDQSNDTNTTYFNGVSWSAATEHATAAPTNTKEFAEFTWSSQNPLKGALIYVTANNDRGMNLKIWTANGSGSGSWGGTNVDTANQGTLGAMELDGGRLGAEEFLACDKDASNDIYCFRGNSTPTWTNPTNQIMTANTDAGTQRSFDVSYEGSTGTQAIVVYADATAPATQARLKKYDAATNTFDAAATNLSTLGGAVKTIKMRSQSVNDEIMIMMGDANNDLYTIVWDGETNQIFTVPTGKAFTTHGTNGPTANDYWYGFAWDAF